MNILPLFVLIGPDVAGMSAGQRFMTDLLVSSLMADGGLEFAMEAAIKKETEVFESKKVITESVCLVVRLTFC